MPPATLHFIGAWKDNFPLMRSTTCVKGTSLDHNQTNVAQKHRQIRNPAMRNEYLQKLVSIIFVSCILGVCAFGQTSNPSPTSFLRYPVLGPGCNDFVMEQTTRWDTKQRLCNYGAQFGDDGGYLGAAFFAGIAQVWDDPPEFEQGIAGYARRFGTRYAQTAAKNTGELITQLLFDEDPRWSTLRARNRGRLRMGDSAIDFRISSRAWHAVRGPFLTPKRRTGTNVAKIQEKFAFERLAGAFASGFVGRAWLPAKRDTLASAFQRTGNAMLVYEARSLWNEFGPDLTRLAAALFHHH